MTGIILFVLAILFVVHSEIKHKQRQEDSGERRGSDREHD